MASISKVFITGATGFVGHWMRETKPENIMLGCVGRDMYLAGWDVLPWDAIVHLAPVSPAPALDYAQKKRIRVMYISSGAVYEQQTDYAKNKRRWEKECRESGVDTVVARLFTFVGAKLKNLYAITHFIENARQGKPLQVLSGGEAVRSYLYGEDLGRWLWKMLLEGEGVYDVGSAVEYTILEAARVVQSVEQVPIEIYTTGPAPNYYMPNVVRARALGCEETVGLKEAIERMLTCE